MFIKNSIKTSFRRTIEFNNSQRVWNDGMDGGDGISKPWFKRKLNFIMNEYIMQ